MSVIDVGREGQGLLIKVECSITREHDLQRAPRL